MTQLLDAGFQVTVLSRSESTPVDSRAQIQKVDYTSKDSLVAALKGQQALVNSVPVQGGLLDTHWRILDAAHAAGIQRYIPSEFGCDGDNKHAASLTVFADKSKIAEKLREISEQDPGFTYTRVYTGMFLDWAMEKNFVINWSSSSTEIYDGGDVPFSSTTLAGVGKAIAGVLKKPEQTKNRSVRVSEATVTQNQLLKLSGVADRIQRVDLKTEDLSKRAEEALKQSPPDFVTFAVSQILYAVFTSKFGTHFDETDNELLGLGTYSEQDLITLLKKYV